MNIVMPMAGTGSRFPRELYPMPKPLIHINNKPMVERAITSFGVDGNWFFIVQDNAFAEYIEIVIKRTVKNYKIITVEELTEGPACSALLFEEDINNKEPLIILNCDQIMEWSPQRFLDNVKDLDGCVVTYHATTEKNSYAKLNSEGYVVEIREKQVISNISLNGIHYWHQGSYFVDSAKEMIAANDRAPNGEFYIGPSYNYMINKGLRVGIYHIPNEQHHAVGVPQDLEKFIKYENSKNK